MHVEDRLAENHWNRFDTQGIPVRGTPSQPLYNITTVCAYWLAYWNLQIRGCGDCTGVLQIVADWLVDQQAPDGSWFYHYDTIFGVKAPWVSGMAQGEALSVLARAYALTGKTTYLEAGNKALTLFERPVAAGGVMQQFTDGLVFFEEAPSEPPSLILNGFLYALFGLYDWSSVAPELSRRHFEAGLKTLASLLLRYDTGCWSRYDLYPGKARIASFAYHDLHIAQLTMIDQLMPNRLWVVPNIIARWQQYRRQLRCRLNAASRKAYFTFSR